MSYFERFFALHSAIQKWLRNRLVVTPSAFFSRLVEYPALKNNTMACHGIELKEDSYPEKSKIAKRTLIQVAIIFSLICQPSVASEVSILPDSDNILLLSGDIIKGDAEKLVKGIFLLNYKRLDLLLILDSQGGSIEESLNIASTVKAFHLNTIVQGGGICTSSCFYIFLAGDAHVAAGAENGKMPKGKAGYLGLHRPYINLDPVKQNDSNGAEAHENDLMQIVAGYLRYQNIPQYLIDLMMFRPSNDLYWMTMEDISLLGKYRPALEELLISRCGYSRNSTSDKVAECILTAFPDYLRERLANRNRLLQGWRPWLVASQTDTVVKEIQTDSDYPEHEVVPAGKFIMGVH